MISSEKETLLEELSQVWLNNDDDGFNKLLRFCRNTLDLEFSRRNKKNIRGKKNITRRTSALFTNKTLSKETMKKSNLRNEYLKCRNEEDRQRFVKQRNLCVSPLRNTRRNYYWDLSKKKVIDN